MQSEPTSGTDALVERVSRWTARRTTRRSVLSKSGRAAMLLAVGSGFAVAMEGRAEARVCGQSGVAPKCPTYDCTAIWGWCWYASGCCADGGLKMICDCCAPNTPHPVGYCPSGTRVKCIVESCGLDPRVMAKPLMRVGSEAVEIALAASRARYPGGAATAVIGDGADVGLAALASSIGRVVDGPVLLTRTGLDERVRDELRRLGVDHAWVVGPTLGGIEDELSRAGVRPNRVGAASGVTAASVELATWSRARTGFRSAVVVTPGAAGALGAAAALAHVTGRPLLFGAPEAVRGGLDDPRGVRDVVVVTEDERAAEGLPAGPRLVHGDMRHLSALVAARTARSSTSGTLALAAEDTTAEARVALAAWRSPMALLGADLGPVLGLVLEIRDRLTDVALAGSPSGQVIHDLQSAVNGFDAHILVGRPGQGLPVIPQPHAERPIGQAQR